jgi:alanine dehydrogenase
MRIGIPKEIKAEETRVAITPSGVSALVAHGHEVFVEHIAGQGSSIPDDLYLQGARIRATASAVWEQAGMLFSRSRTTSQELCVSVRIDGVYLPPSRAEGRHANVTLNSALPPRL